MSGGASPLIVRNGAIASFAVLIVFLAAWQWGPGLLGIPSFIVPPLSMVGDRVLARLAVRPSAVSHRRHRRRGLAGFVLGSLLGAVVGYLLGLSPTAEFVLSPYILALQIAPKVAFAPLFILWMGFTVYPKMIVTVLIVFFPIMVNVLKAMRGVDRDLINLARAFKASAQDLLEGRIPDLDAADVGGPTHRRDARRHRRLVGELVGGERAWLSAQLSAKARPIRRWYSSPSRC